MENKVNRAAGGSKKKVLAIVGVILVLVLGYLGFNWYNDQHNYVTTDNAKITGDLLSTSPRIPGKIAEIKVNTGDIVRKGEILFTLETDQINAQIKQAEAALDIAKAQLNKAVGGARSQEITGAQSLVDQANAAYSGAAAGRDSLKSVLDNVQGNYDTLLSQMGSFKDPSTGKIDANYAMQKINTAYAKKMLTDAQYTVQTQEIEQLFASKAQLEAQILQLKGQLKGLNASVDASKAGLDGATSKLKLVTEGASSKDIAILVNTVKAAQATLDLAKLSLNYAGVKAANDGTVVQITGHVGDIVSPGLSVMSLVDLSKLDVTAYVLENDLENVKVGQPVKVSIDAFPGKNFGGTVKEIGLATSSVFSLFGSDNSSGNYTKVSQRIPVKISLNYGDSKVIPGMSATVKIKIAK